LNYEQVADAVEDDGAPVAGLLQPLDHEQLLGVQAR
jgi:hypothetical protein